MCLCVYIRSVGEGSGIKFLQKGIKNLAPSPNLRAQVMPMNATPVFKDKNPKLSFPLMHSILKCKFKSTYISPTISLKVASSP